MSTNPLPGPAICAFAKAWLEGDEEAVQARAEDMVQALWPGPYDKTQAGPPAWDRMLRAAGDMPHTGIVTGILWEVRRGRADLDAHRVQVGPDKAAVGEVFGELARLVFGYPPAPPPWPDPVPLADADRHILKALASAGRPLTAIKIVNALVQTNRTDKTVPRISDRTVRERLKVLRKNQLIARPDGTKRQGDAITMLGLRALGPADKLPKGHR
jgi:hypothetical protein